jgi:hypothetical protein
MAAEAAPNTLRGITLGAGCQHRQHSSGASSAIVQWRQPGMTRL